MTLLTAGSFLLSACDSRPETTRRGEILDTPFEIIAPWDGLSKSAVSKLLDQAEGRLEQRFKLTSREGETLKKLNRDRFVTLSEGVDELFAFAEKTRIATNSAYDYRLGTVRKMWNLNGRRPKQPDLRELSKAAADAAVLQMEVSGGRASLKGAGDVDFERLAEGWAVDAAVDVMISGGVKRGSINLGSVTRVWGGMRDENNPWQVDLQPLEGDSIFKVIRPTEGSLCVIHPSLNGFEYIDIQHARILDPRSGLPSDSAIAVVAWAPNGISAGAYAEALFVMGRRAAFEWSQAHQPSGLILIYFDSREKYVVAESDPILAPCVSDSLPASD